MRRYKFASGSILSGFSRNGLQVLERVIGRAPGTIHAVANSAPVDQCMRDGAQIDIFEFTARRHATCEPGHLDALLANHL